MRGLTGSGCRRSCPTPVERRFELGMARRTLLIHEFIIARSSHLGQRTFQPKRNPQRQGPLQRSHRLKKLRQ